MNTKIKFKSKFLHRKPYLGIGISWICLQNNLNNILNVMCDFKKETIRNFMNFSEFDVIFEYEAIFNLL